MPDIDPLAVQDLSYKYARPQLTQASNNLWRWRAWIGPHVRLHSQAIYLTRAIAAQHMRYWVSRCDLRLSPVEVEEEDPEPDAQDVG
jgi:hypothetical protein